MDQLKIETVEITNFRSIRKLQCNLSDISVFVGQNDVGKSNILKALNLFFNGEAEPGRELLFNEDFNSAGHRQKKADEIRIKVTFSLPQSYRKTNGEYLVYEKRWRESGEVTPEMFRKPFYGMRNKKEVPIKKKSKVRQLINRINYIYVPAIRGMNYFDSLRLRIYQTLTRIAQDSLSQASSTFEGNIGRGMTKLLEATQDIFHEDVILSFPEDLSKIFEKLDFLFGKGKISINRRGDGIKGQYIPVILNFISVSERQLPKQGGPYTFIWGYEEPENNTEIRRCIEMRDQFIEYVQNSISQILITTHSPVYYNIMEHQAEGVKFGILHVTKDAEEGTSAEDASGGLDEELGSVAMMSEAYKRQEAELKKSEQEKAELNKLLAAKQQPCLFVEGPTDKMVIEKLLAVFGIGQNFGIDDNRGNGGGANFVLDTLKAWENEKKFKKTRPNAAGLVDEDAKDEVRKFVKRDHPKGFVKHFVMKGSDEVKMWKQKNKFMIDECLETFYPKEIWEMALKEGWLEEKETSEIFNEGTRDACVDGKENKDELLSDAPLYITHRVRRESKIEMAKLVCDLEDNQLREAFADIQPMLEKIAEFLNRKPMGKK